MFRLCLRKLLKKSIGVFTNEGVYALKNLLKEDEKFQDYEKINGIVRTFDNKIK